MVTRVIDPNTAFPTIQPSAQPAPGMLTQGADIQASQQTSQHPSQQQSVSGPSAMDDLKYVTYKSGTAQGGFTGTGIAESYNKIYDFATGWDATAVPGTNLATGTTSSGTFGGSNVGNVAYGYAGGKLANELFDNKGYSDIGGSLGASLGASAAVGGSAAGAAMSTLGWAAGPVGAIAGAVLGAALGSMMGGAEEDFRFRTYSGELGDYSDLNKNQMAEQASDWASIGSRQDEAYDRWMGGDYSTNTSSAYKWLKEGNTFAIGDAVQLHSEGKLVDTSGNLGKLLKKTDLYKSLDPQRSILEKDYASFDGPFGKYTVGHVDDIPGRTKFAQSWVDAIGQLDAAAASVLTPEQIALSKEGLKGSIQGTPDFKGTSGQNYATDAMIIDRYAVIFELAGRDDLAQQLTTGMDRSISAMAEREGEMPRAIEVLTDVLKAETGVGSSPTPVVTRPSVQRPTGGSLQRGQQAVSQARPQTNYTISRPESTVNPAMTAITKPVTQAQQLRETA